VRAFIAAHYGERMVHDFSKGEFPRLIAAMRSVESARDNRLVMVTQEALTKMRREIPALAPLIDRLPPPGPGTYSCEIYHVCSEVVNGWMLFWIKDAAFNAGLTPDLPSAQAYFRKVREEIEEACRSGRLTCRSKGSGLVPRFELRWVRAYTYEWFSLLRMIVAPTFHVAGKMPAFYDVDAEFMRMFQAVTLTRRADIKPPDGGAKPADTALAGSSLGVWRLAIADFYRHVGWLLLPAAMVAFAVRLAHCRRVPLDAFSWAAVVILGYLVLRLGPMSYVLAYMGQAEQRVMFSTYVLLMLLAPLLIVDCVRAVRGHAAEAEDRGMA
ncbi:MAG: hypothetical protein WBM28_11150, partial [Burkholderiales bacterium]